MKTDLRDKILDILAKQETIDLRFADLESDDHMRGYYNAQVDERYADARRSIMYLTVVGEQDP